MVDPKQSDGGNRRGAIAGLAIAVILIAAAIWAVTFYQSLWAHMAAFSKWVPSTMAAPATK